jgi:IS30 family transposase
MHAQITLEERYAIMALKKQRFSIRAIASALGRSPSTISREYRRNLRPSGRYNPDVAHSYTVARRRRSRRNTHFTDDEWCWWSISSGWTGVPSRSPGGSSCMES